MKSERLVTGAGIALTLVAVGLGYGDIAETVMRGHAGLLEAIVIGLLLSALVYGSLVYLVARDGYAKRRQSYRAPCLDELEERYLGRASTPRVCILIPSYKEELRVLRQTVLSAALCIYGARRIVVLVDDPQPSGGKDLQSLEATRAFVAEVHRQFHRAATRVRAAYSEFLLRSRRESRASALAETQGLARAYEDVADFVEQLARHALPDSPDKADRFLIERIVRPCAERHRARARWLRAAQADPDGIDREFRRLISQLSIDVSSFERKRYENLSHAPNKAMNLNSYIGLMGKCFRVVTSARDRFLEECASARADLIVPEAPYLLTLDADSMVLPDYLLKLVDIMEGDASIAVAQTPYSAIAGEASALERAAGAQTDLQYVVHQGSAQWNAAFWVGANALLRLAALRSIRTTEPERGHEVPVYIQDRTVIEDTGSTIDLIRRGWKLHNHPERLAYSATPPDFGSLIIQRRRWSNGGLIIFPDLLRHARGKGGARPSAGELFLRTHYLCGPALTAISLLLLLVLPFNRELLSPWLAVAALPYYGLYLRDARKLEYRWRELLDVYTLSLMLLPITLAGVLRSIQQALTGHKSAFGRTPKTESRTGVQPLHVVLQLALFLLVACVAWRSAASGHFYLAGFSIGNTLLLARGFANFLGIREAWDDVTWLLRRPAHVEVPATPAVAEAPSVQTGTAAVRAPVPAVANARRRRAN